MMAEEEEQKKAANQGLAWELYNTSQTYEYQEMLQHRSNLPIWSFKEEILKAVKGHQVVVLSGLTGCGKTTQVRVCTWCVCVRVYTVCVYVVCVLYTQRVCVVLEDPF